MKKNENEQYIVTKSDLLDRMIVGSNRNAIYYSKESVCRYCIPNKVNTIAMSSTFNTDIKLDTNKERLHIMLNDESVSLNIEYCPMCGRKLNLNE